MAKQQVIARHGQIWKKIILMFIILMTGRWSKNRDFSLLNITDQRAQWQSSFKHFRKLMYDKVMVDVVVSKIIYHLRKSKFIFLSGSANLIGRDSRDALMT